ncbi:ROK family protein (plasmid) [Rhizobium sullae]|uniref:ROK family protein n=1 Tax=Rhizobium sullae TaxID=50338 RepID=A0ABY5XSE3_RHISU|nr:ROK family protein [Rhizobium sullae]UWU17426.1 ROK family protein [Rhizobium sullae]
MPSSAMPVTVEMLISVNPKGSSEPRLVGRIVGVDLGGTKILAGIADADGRILATREEATLHGEGAPVLDQMALLIHNLVADIGSSINDLDSVVIGIPGAVNPATGLGSLSPNLALPADRSLRDLMASRIACEVVVENDVNLAAYAEASAGAGRGERSLVFISFGTGVGMGLVLNGDLWRGEFGRAGEIGYLPVGEAPHMIAPFSQNGLYEDAVGSRGIRDRFTSNGDTVSDLFAAARGGDSQALVALDEIARSASVGLAAIHALLDPAITVVGGGIGSQAEFFELLKAHLTPLLPFACRIEHSHFGPRAGMVGAVMLAARHLAKGPEQRSHLAS